MTEKPTQNYGFCGILKSLRVNKWILCQIHQSQCSVTLNWLCWVWQILAGDGNTDIVDTHASVYNMQAFLKSGGSKAGEP